MPKAKAPLRSQLPWYLSEGDEECPHCGQWYAYELEVRCVDCDVPSCPHCQCSNCALIETEIVVTEVESHGG